VFLWSEGPKKAPTGCVWRGSCKRVLDCGLDLALPIAKETVDGKTVFFVDRNVLVACFSGQPKAPAASNPDGVLACLLADLPAGKPVTGL